MKTPNPCGGTSELGHCQMLPFLKSKRPSMCRRAFGEPGLYSYEARYLLAIAALCARIPLPALGDSFPDELNDVARFSARPEYTLDS